MPSPTLAPATLAASTDAELHAGLLRLYALHRDADDAGKALVHADIMAVLGVMSARLDEWVAAR